MSAVVDANLQWHLIGSCAEIKADEPAVRKIGIKQIAIYSLADGSYSAVSDICTHQYASLSKGFLDGHMIECPLHQACFDIRNGSCGEQLSRCDQERSCRR
jgi:nitrite reductase/ring-hydroxylating ferredoxin subunit